MSRRRYKLARETSILGYPAFTWLVGFIALPLIIVFLLSFLTRGTYGGVEYALTLDNYLRVFEPIYFKIFIKSLKLALITASICLVLAYPVAWAIAASPKKWRERLLILIAIPFFTNLIIRVYAIKLFVGIGGPLQSALASMGFTFDPFYLSQNSYLVFYSLIMCYLPFTVFPLYAAFEKFDFSLIEAAQDLGAGSIKILFNVILPQTRTAAVSGFVLVFIPCMGEFVTPDLLGGAKTMLIGNLITEQFLKARDWTFGSALSIVLMLILIVLPYLVQKIVKIRKEARSLE